MVRTYKRKTDRKLISPSKLREAAKLVKGGWAVRAAARYYNINKSSLWSKLKKLENTKTDISVAEKSSFKTSHASRNVFTSEQEQTLVNYCIDVAKMGYGLTIQEVRALAYEVALNNKIHVPSNWEKEKMAGIDWFYGFKKRHSELSIRTPEACSIARAMAFNPHNVKIFQDKLEEVINRHECFRDGSRVYNIDETSTSTVQNTKKLVSPKGLKQVHQVKTAERGVSVTTSVIIGAYGILLPPVMIFPRIHFKDHMLINSYPGTLGLANKNGYNTKETFVKILEHFIKCTRSSKDNPTLLLMDNVDTHFSTDSLDLAKENGVVIFTFPPHCTHKLQPLDVGFFGPFKAHYNSAIHSFILSNPGISVTIYHVAGFVREALSKTATPKTIINSFVKTGICPFNRNVFDETDFIMASVTEQPRPVNDSDCEINQDSLLPTLSLSPLSTLPLEEQNPTEEVSFLGPAEIRGFPHAKPQITTKKPRRKGKCMVATDTPEKQKIDRREKDIKEKRLKVDRRKRLRENSNPRQGNNLKKEGKEKKKATTSRVLTYESNDDIENDSLENDSSKSFPPLTYSPSEGDYVMVCFQKGKGNKYYVGKIIGEQDDKGDMQISYMRKTNAIPPRFTLPDIPDLKSVHVNDIKVILPKPVTNANTTKRTQSILTFDFQFRNLNLG